MGDRSALGGETGGYVASELSGGKTGSINDLRGGETGGFSDLTDKDSGSQNKGIIGGIKDAVGGITGASSSWPAVSPGRSAALSACKLC